MKPFFRLTALIVLMATLASPLFAQPSRGMQLRGNWTGSVGGVRITGGAAADPTVLTCTKPSFYVKTNGSIYGCDTGGHYAALANVSTTPTFVSITGPLTGNVTGNVTGNLTGNVTGNVTGNLTGNVTGNIAGTLSTLNTQGDALLAHNAAVDLNTDTPPTVLTCPTGKSCIVTKIIVSAPSISLTTWSGSFGWESSTYANVVANATHTGLDGATKYVVLSPISTGGVIGTSTGTLKCKDNTKQGSAATAVVDVFGYVF